MCIRDRAGELLTELCSGNIGHGLSGRKPQIQLQIGELSQLNQCGQGERP